MASPAEALEVSGSIVLDGVLDNTSGVGLDVRLSGTSALSLIEDAVCPSIIIGHVDNAILDAAAGVSIGGGGASLAANVVYDDYGVIGGGLNNILGTNDGDPTTTVGAVIAGGDSNVAAAAYSSIGGGQLNTILSTAVGASIPGGVLNTVSAPYSLAAGVRAKALHTGSFVWGDSQAADLSTTQDNQFIVRAEGGIWLGDDSAVSFPLGSLLATSSGGYLTALGLWISVSDRDKKTDFEEFDKQDLLEKVADLSVTTWMYKDDETGSRHIGPVAQDFYHAFGVGPDERHVAATDLSGVSLAAIQALYERVTALEAEVVSLRAQVESKDRPARPRAVEVIAPGP
ncbi:MAG: tail fiber domain-containing protein [Phycisphaera sp.]|nr:MAG: tail fiber domain-containing protein [Phycisphaera sp.]